MLTKETGIHGMRRQRKTDQNFRDFEFSAKAHNLWAIRDLRLDGLVDP